MFDDKLVVGGERSFVGKEREEDVGEELTTTSNGTARLAKRV